MRVTSLTRPLQTLVQVKDNEVQAACILAVFDRRLLNELTPAATQLAFRLCSLLLCKSLKCNVLAVWYICGGLIRTLLCFTDIGGLLPSAAST